MLKIVTPGGTYNVAGRGPAGPTGPAGLNWLGAWDSGTTYVVDDAVENDGSAYICTAESTNNEPPNASYWDVLASKGDQGDTGDVGMTWMGAWDSGTTYVVDDVVESGGSAYICVLESTNNEPPNATYWAVLASKGATGATGPAGTGGTNATSYEGTARTNNAGEYVDVTNFTVDITPTATSYLWIAATFSSKNSSASDYASLYRVVVDGSAVDLYARVGNANADSYYPVSMVGITSGTYSAAAHTVKVQVWVLGGTTTTEVKKLSVLAIAA
jgi:hypothetical protein